MRVLQRIYKSYPVMWLALITLAGMMLALSLFNGSAVSPAAAQTQADGAKAMLQSARAALERAVAEEKNDPSEETRLAALLLRLPATSQLPDAAGYGRRPGCLVNRLE
jgi:hypothetical protein